MKPFRSFFSAAALTLAVFSTAAHAATFQVVDDTVGSPKTATIAKASGLATTLPVSVKSTAFIKFDVSNSNIVPSAVTQARLVIFFSKLSKTGTLTLNVNGSDFTELFPTKTIPAPTVASTVGTVTLVPEDTRSFLVFDVTAQVVAWLDGSVAENGFSITSDGVANVLLGSKEGAGTGYPAVLEVDAAGTGGPVSGSDATFTGTLSAGSGSFGGPLSATTGSFTGGVSGTTGAFSGAVSGTSGTFTSGVSGTTGTFSGAVSGTTGTFSSTLSGAGGRFTGNVGIGTTTPGFKLEVADTSAVELALRSTSTNGRVYTLQSSNGGPTLGDGTFQIVDRTAVAARFIIDKTGNVGIGSYDLTFPAAKFDVKGNIQARGDVKLGPSAQFFAVSGEENLRTVRGLIGGIPASPVPVEGSGYTVARTPGFAVGSYDVSYSTAFSETPAVTCTPYHATQERFNTISNYGPGFVTIRIYNKFGGLEDGDFFFTATGPR